MEVFCYAYYLTGITPLNDPDKEVQIRHMWVNANFLPTCNIELKGGSNFSNLPLSKTAYILNEAAAKMLPMQTAVGSEFISRGGKHICTESVAG